MSAYLRHPLSLLTAVSLLIGFVWYVLGLPVQMPPSPLAGGEKLACVAYAPEADDPVPLARIEADLAALAPYASCVRTFRAGGGMEYVPEVAARHGLAVLQGLAIGRDSDANRAEIEHAARIAADHRERIRAFIVGDRVLSRREMRTGELVRIVGELRRTTGRPVTVIDLPDTWLDADTLADAVDFIALRVPLYDAAFPVSAARAAEHTISAWRSVAQQFPGKSVTLIEAGWPSAGRMRDAAYASPANQAFVLHRLVAAANGERLELTVFEGGDEPRRASRHGTAAGHWGLLSRDTGNAKFVWGLPVENHPLWFIQATTGIVFALIVFAAAYLAARTGRQEIAAAPRWNLVALVALAAGAPLGEAVAGLPVQSHTLAEWTVNSLLLVLALAVPPICAAAVMRDSPLESFATILDRSARRSMPALPHAASIAFMATVFLAIYTAVTLAAAPAGRGFPAASLTGPAIAVLTFAAVRTRSIRRTSLAEIASALVLILAAALIVFNETFWNWQALWLAGALAAVSLACWLAARAQRS